MSAILVAEIFCALNFSQIHKNRQELFIIMTGGRSPYYVTKKKKAWFTESSLSKLSRYIKYKSQSLPLITLHMHILKSFMFLRLQKIQGPIKFKHLYL